MMNKYNSLVVFFPARKVWFLLSAMWFCAFGLGDNASAATFVVDNANTTGTGTLHQAVLDANASPGTDTITFNIAALHHSRLIPSLASILWKEFRGSLKPLRSTARLSLDMRGLRSFTWTVVKSNTELDCSCGRTGFLCVD